VDPARITSAVPALTTVILSIIAAVQAVFLAVLAFYLVSHRSRIRRRARAETAAAESLSVPLHRFLLGTGDADQVRRHLAALAPDQALEQLTRLAALRVAPERQEALAAALGGERWVTRALKGARSRRWWKRLAAVRLLAAVGTQTHRAMLRRLLLDRHPAVQLAAASCLGRVADSDLVSLVVETLPGRPIAVQHYLFAALRQCWSHTVPLVARRLRADTPAQRLEVWINLSEVLATPAVLAPVLRLAKHPDQNVRLAVARALKHYFHPDTPPVLFDLIEDDDWRVRAQAARALGVLKVVEAVGPLGRLLRDSAWWVRFRAALSLAQLGEPGRRMLREARIGGDRYASEMATMISGLSGGGVLELADA
jgi:HEAT repeat protein